MDREGLLRSLNDHSVEYVVIGAVAYVLAYVLAILIDLPFGPVLTGLLVLAASLRFLTAIRRRNVELSGDDLHFQHLSPPRAD